MQPVPRTQIGAQPFMFVVSRLVLQVCAAQHALFVLESKRSSVHSLRIARKPLRVCRHGSNGARGLLTAAQPNCGSQPPRLRSGLAGLVGGRESAAGLPRLAKDYRKIGEFFAEWVLPP